MGEDVTLQQPDKVMNSLGECGGNGDSLTIQNPSTSFVGFNSLCGSLSGQHIYIHYSINTNVNTIENVYVNLSIGSSIFKRYWKIKTSRIECGSPDKANEGCLQWFTDIGGRIKSFNYHTTTKIMIKNLLYNICIRNGEGMCGMSVFQTRIGNPTSADSFLLNTDLSTTGIVDANCAKEF